MSVYASIKCNNQNINTELLYTDLDLSSVPFMGSTSINCSNIHDEQGNTLPAGVHLSLVPLLIAGHDFFYGTSTCIRGEYNEQELIIEGSIVDSTQVRIGYTTKLGGTTKANRYLTITHADNTEKLLLIIKDASGRYFMLNAGASTRLNSSVFLVRTPIYESIGTAYTEDKFISGTVTIDDITPFVTVRTIGDDPYAEGGESESGGGDGNFDFSSTVIPIPGLPNIGATDTGFISLYKPSAVQLKSLANYMWAGAFDITQFKKLFADPMDAILGLHIIPTTSTHPATGSASLVIGNIDTGLTMPTCLEQYYEADMGEINVPAKWGAYLDYSPYTKLSLYLPYIGFVPLSPDDCMRGSIKVVYHVDVLSGTCMAFVYCVSNRGQDGHTLYMFNGSCSCDCPVTSGQYRSALEGLLGVAGSIGRVAAGDVAGGLKDAVSNVTSMLKPEIGRSGSFGGSGGLMGIQYPYLVLTVPRMCIPGQQNTYIGYPSFVTKTIGDLTGFTSIDVTHLENMTCTEAEAEEIISILSEGVIL